MLKIIVLALLVIPPWVASEFDAPKWVLIVSAAPFFLYAMTLDDPDEHLLGEASGAFRKGALVGLGIGGLVLGIGFYILWKALVTGA
ncbi:hypothetical protein [Arenimonas oryziterrae]|uniref:Uncharacterized protein n=1 Tax=Arenimonas oryziterrae DSM 21050 = YC6267 TaxID=1121015 RepID=A0A091BF89_9GAMM|nr:hypothetical protein [Arenimonas oryziterrae]KFN43035.1 hypothetical protein N789_10765 [Arenimonas oryziterrae DSM 21050 = YC6267]